MNLQARYELAVAEREMGPRINAEVQQVCFDLTISRLPSFPFPQ